MEEQSIQVVKILIILLLLYVIYPTSNFDRFSSKKTIYWFHRPGCPHCDNMKNDWNQLSGVVSKKYKLKAINTSIPKNAKLGKKYGVKGVPHIVKTNGGSKYEVYNGNRSVIDMKQWIDKK